MSEPIPGSKRDTVGYLPDIHRLLPQDPAAEQGVLSCLLLSPREVGDAIRDRNITTDHFHIPAHATVFEAAMDLLEKKKPLDFITLTGALRGETTLASSAPDSGNVGKLSEVGGAGFITHLWTYLPTAANAAFYLETLQRKETARRIIRTATEYVAKAYDAADDQLPELLDTFQRDVCAIETGAKNDDATVVPIAGAVVEAMQSIEATYNNRGKEVLGTPFGYFALDRMTGGMNPGNLVLVAGRASMGKSAFLWDAAQHIAERRGPVLGFSLEMNRRELAERYICYDAAINMQRLRDGFLSEDQFKKMRESARRLHKELREWVDETGAITIQEVRAKARRFKLRHPDMAAIVIDYIQLMKSRTRRAQDSENAEISEVSSGLKALAKELGIPIIAGAQINRDGDTAGKPPKLSNLRGSGSLEQDADIVIILHRPGYYSKADEDADKITAFLAKQRQGPTGDVQLFWSDWARIMNPPNERPYSNNPEQRQGGAAA